MPSQVLWPQVIFFPAAAEVNKPSAMAGRENWDISSPSPWERAGDAAAEIAAESFCTERYGIEIAKL
jgi:hypothetical protein